MVEYRLRRFKTIINKMKYIDGWFWCRYTLNPYSGCEHACIYCDARSSRYYLHEDFDDIIFVKEDADKILENQLKNSRTLLPDIVAIGGVCDAYQPAEKKFRNTRKILKVLNKYKFPVEVSTKSTLIGEDLELIDEIANDTWANIFFTITTTDQELVDFLEPRTSPPEERFELIKEIRKDYPKINVGINFMPIIPYLEDSDDNLRDIISKGQKFGAQYILFAPGLTLRDNQKEFFINKMKKKYPVETENLLKLYKENQEPSRLYKTEIIRKVAELCNEYGISTRLKRWIPNDFRKVNYQISEKLWNESYNRQYDGKAYSSYQKAGMNLSNLKESILRFYKKGKLFDLEFLTPEIGDDIVRMIKNKKSSTLDNFF